MLIEFKVKNNDKKFAKPITIGNNVWIGGGAICPSVTIGNNVVIAAGTDVTKDFSDSVLIGGNLAKIIKTIDNS